MTVGPVFCSSIHSRIRAEFLWPHPLAPWMLSRSSGCCPGLSAQCPPQVPYFWPYGPHVCSCFLPSLFPKSVESWFSSSPPPRLREGLLAVSWFLNRTKLQLQNPGPQHLLCLPSPCTGWLWSDPRGQPHPEPEFWVTCETENI